MDTEELFDRLANNMFANLSKSIDNIENDKKTAVIYYFSALELLFKARLLYEHWTLILNSPDVEDNMNIFNNFKQGNFKSIDFETAAKRIRNLLQDLDKGYEKNFLGIKDIRNKLIHFDYMTEESAELSITNITMSWYYFYKLLNEKWKNIFVKYQDKISDINIKMHKYSNHLWESKKQALIKDNINKYKKNPKYRILTIDGKSIICNVCNISYDSKENISLLNTNYDNETFTLTLTCEVCGNIETILLPALYINNKNLSFVFKDKFNEYINNNEWLLDINSTVSKGFIKPLLEADASNIDIDFSDFEETYSDELNDNIYIEEVNKESSNLIVKELKPFSIVGYYNIPLNYVLYVKIILKLNIKKEMAENSDFEALYNSIIGYDIDFSIDSDGY